MPWNCTIIAISGSLLSYLLKLAAIDKKLDNSSIRGPQGQIFSAFLDFDAIGRSGFGEESEFHFYCGIDQVLARPRLYDDPDRPICVVSVDDGLVERHLQGQP